MTVDYAQRKRSKRKGRGEEESGGPWHGRRKKRSKVRRLCQGMCFGPPVLEDQQADVQEKKRVKEGPASSRRASKRARREAEADGGAKAGGRAPARAGKGARSSVDHPQGPTLRPPAAAGSAPRTHLEERCWGASGSLRVVVEPGHPEGLAALSAAVGRVLADGPSCPATVLVAVATGARARRVRAALQAQPSLAAAGVGLAAGVGFAHVTGPHNSPVPVLAEQGVHGGLGAASSGGHVLWCEVPGQLQEAERQKKGMKGVVRKQAAASCVLVGTPPELERVLGATPAPSAPTGKPRLVAVLEPGLDQVPAVTALLSAAHSPALQVVVVGAHELLASPPPEWAFWGVVEAGPCAVGLSALPGAHLTQRVEVCSEERRRARLLEVLHDLEAAGAEQVLLVADGGADAGAVLKPDLKLSAWHLVDSVSLKAQEGKEGAQRQQRRQLVPVDAAALLAGAGRAGGPPTGWDALLWLSFPGSVGRYADVCGQPGLLRPGATVFAPLAREQAALAAPALALLEACEQAPDPNLQRLAAAYAVVQAKLQQAA